MMPGIAIQTGFPLAGASAARSAPPAADDRFADALRGKPKGAAQADRKSDEDAKAGATDNSDGAKAASRDNGNDSKVDQPAHAKEDSSDDSGKEKKKNDKGDGALPPHMMAERTLARQWPVTGQAVAVTNGSTATSAPTGNIDAAAPAAGGTQPFPLAGANGTTQPGTALPIQGLPAQPTAPMGKDGGGTAAPMEANPAGANPALNNVSVVTTAADARKAGPDNTSAAFMAKVAGTQHETGPGGSPQGTGGTASTSTPDAKPAASQILQTAAGQNSGNADANADGQGDGGNGQSNNAAQNTAQLSLGAKSDAAAAPLPAAQMIPYSGSATSFAGALQQGGALARYAAGAAAALAAGTSANALPAQSLSIQLRPVELGSVTAHLKYAGSGLSIDIEVETPEAHRRLSNDSSDIVKSLQTLGFQVDKVTVRQAPAQAQMQSQSQPQGQSQGQAMGRDGSAGGSANQGGSPFSMSGQSGGNGHRQGSESGYENASERGIGMVRETTDRVSRRGVFI